MSEIEELRERLKQVEKERDESRAEGQAVHDHIVDHNPDVIYLSVMEAVGGLIRSNHSFKTLSQTCLSYFHAQSAYLHAMNTKQPDAAELCMKATTLRDKALKMAESLGIKPL